MTQARRTTTASFNLPVNKVRRLGPSSKTDLWSGDESHVCWYVIIC